MMTGSSSSDLLEFELVKVSNQIVQKVYPYIFKGVLVDELQYNLLCNWATNI